MREGVGYLTQAVEKGYSLSEGDGQKLIATYLQIGESQQALAILEQFVVRYPTSTQYWGSLATLYAQLGRTQEALMAARKVLELSTDDPTLKAEAEQFIRNLGGTP
jgi:Flp pilus assembly protein TadD